MTDLLFESRPSPSPLLRWMWKHNITVSKIPEKDLWRAEGKDSGWYCGETALEAMQKFAIAEKLPFPTTL